MISGRRQHATQQCQVTDGSVLGRAVLCCVLCLQEVSVDEASAALTKDYLRNNKVINLEDYAS